MEYDDLYSIGPITIIPIPDWFKFFSSLGAYIIRNPGTKNIKNHIAVTLPGTDSVPLVTAAGMSDTIFTRRLMQKTIVNRITSLTEGQTIFVTRENKREICTFKDIIPHPYPKFPNERCARLISKGMTTMFPERNWSQLQIAATNQQYKRKQIKGLGFKSSFLKELYGKEKLMKAASEYNTEYYLVGCHAKIEQLSNHEAFSYKSVRGTFSDLLCFKGAQSTYFHSVIVSNVRKSTKEEQFVPNIPVIFFDALSYLNKSYLSPRNPTIIFLNRTDTGDRNNEVVLDIKRRILEKDSEIITDSVIEALGGIKQVPFGIELLAWREK